MAWETRGLLLPAPLPVSWAVTHAALPHAETLSDGRVRMYVSSRDDRGRSQIGRVEFDAAAPGSSMNVVEAPLLRPGPLGAFDDAGVTTSCLVRDGERQLLYYTGWSLGATVPFFLFVGCAVSEDGGETFGRVSAAPILERNDVDPYLTASPWILVEEDRWRMWYVSGTEWEIVDGRPRHRYLIKHAESHDGISWSRDGHVCIDYRDADEYAISRPCVIRDGATYRMWFSARGESYRIEHAESDDGLHWTRLGSVGIESSGEWDAEMQAYPAVLDHGGSRYLLYNGNGYGESGVGWAAWIASA